VPVDSATAVPVAPRPSIAARTVASLASYASADVVSFDSIVPLPLVSSVSVNVPAFAFWIVRTCVALVVAPSGTSTSALGVGT
jgi:hypothetical protein